MPVTDILVRDFGMMGQAYCTVGLMCKSKCLQSSAALQTILTKILNHFYRTPDRYFTKFGIYKIYTHCTYYYLHWDCHQTMQLVLGMIIFSIQGFRQSSIEINRHLTVL